MHPKILALASSAALITATLLPATPAIADPTTDDINCPVLTSLMVDSQAPQAHAAGGFGSLYYEGKLHVLPSAQVTGLAIAQAPAVTGLLKPELGRCLGEIQGRVLALQGTAANAATNAPPPATPPAGNDMYCLAANVLTTESITDPAAKAALQLPSLYYIGKLSGEGNTDFTAQLAAAALTLKSTDAQQTEMAKCDIELKAQRASVQTLGATLHQQLKANPFDAIKPPG